MGMETNTGVNQEMLKARSPQLFQVLPCHFVFPIPALSAYQGQIALEQETTSEEIVLVQLELCHKTRAYGSSKHSPSSEQSAFEVCFLV